MSLLSLLILLILVDISTGIPCGSMGCAQYCGQGDFFDPEKGTCLRCPEGTYQYDTPHTHVVCVTPPDPYVPTREGIQCKSPQRCTWYGCADNRGPAPLCLELCLLRTALTVDMKWRGSAGWRSSGECIPLWIGDYFCTSTYRAYTYYNGQYDDQAMWCETGAECTSCLAGSETEFECRRNGGEGDRTCRACSGANLCPTGTYTSVPCQGMNPPQCATCPVGKYSDTVGVNTCTQCPNDTYPNQERTACVPCLSTPRQYRDSSNLMSPCQNCTTTCSGQDVPMVQQCVNGMDTPCFPCDPINGVIFSPSTGVCNECSSCQPGKYVSKTCNLTTDVTCSDCQPGKYSTNRNSPQCTTCLQGKYTQNTGSTSCASCTAGKYSSNGASTCTECGIGYYTTETNPSSCIPCSPCPVGWTYPIRDDVPSCAGSTNTKIHMCELCQCGVGEHIRDGFCDGNYKRLNFGPGKSLFQVQILVLMFLLLHFFLSAID